MWLQLAKQNPDCYIVLESFQFENTRHNNSAKLVHNAIRN